MVLQLRLSAVFRTLLSVVFTVAVCLASASSAHAWGRYYQGCDTCHGDFGIPADTWVYSPPGGGPDWSGNLHQVHRQDMQGECGLCHLAGSINDPYVNWSDGTVTNSGFGCMGCHGRIKNGEQWPSAWGLLNVHLSVTGNNCLDCHTMESADPENVETQPYYGTVDSLVGHPCNDDASTSEDWSGDGVGLDNDGDGLVDGNDPDCGTPPSCGDGAINGAEVCDGAELAGEDCVSQGFAGGALACLVDCTDYDTTGCTTAGTCGDSTVDPGETCDPPASCPTLADCDDGDACTDDSLTGDSATCDAECVNAPRTACVDGDGCCPSGCDGTTDDDCALPPGDGGGGCGCRTSMDASPVLFGFLLLTFAVLLLVRRRTPR